MKHEAPNTFYKTAEQLDLPIGVYETLIKVRDMLESGEIREPGPSEICVPVFQCRADTAKLFRYSTWSEDYACGTVACIGGWIEKLGQPITIPLDEQTDPPTLLLRYGGMPFQRLLYGPFRVPDDHGYRSLGIQEAITAINNYLSTGEAMWKSVVGPGATYWPAHFGEVNNYMYDEDGNETRLRTTGVL